MISIQKAGIEDIEVLVPLLDAYRVFYKQTPDQEACRKFLKERLTRDESVIFIAYSEKRPVGFTQLYTTFSSVSLKPQYILNDLFVTQECRGLGIGEALLNKAKELCRVKGYKGLALETATDNPAQRLYERLDWKKDTHCFHYFWTAPEHP